MILKIREQLIFFFSIIIVFSVGISAYFAIIYTQSSIIESEITTMHAFTNEIMHHIDTLHERASEDLVFALKNPKFVEYFELPETKAGNVYDENGVLQFTDNQRRIKQELEQWIYHFQNKFDVDETCLIDVTGQEHARLVLTKIEIDENLSPDEESAPFFAPSFLKPKNEVHIQYPYVSPDTERWVFAYTSPVELGNGQKPAIYHFEMPLTIFSELLETGDGRMYVLDPKGYVIADSGGLVPDTVIDFAPEKQFPPFQSVFASGTSELLNEMKSNEMGSGKYAIDGQDHYFTYHKLTTFDWILVYEKPVSMMFVGANSIDALMMTIGIIAIFASVLGVLGVFMISSRVSEPISKLAKAISLENPERLEELHAPNHEISQISHSVNTLIKKITHYQEELNLKNHELTIQKQQLERFAKVGEIASSLAHNLRTPLAVIKTTVEILQTQNLDEKSQERLNRIHTATGNLEKQIQEVLTYVKNKPLDLKEILLQSLLESTLKTINIPAGIKIISNLDDHVIQCDSDKLQIVLMNIITNAIDVLDKQGTIQISSNHTSHENIIQIQDSGPGIPPENLTKIFDSLFTTKSYGTGLGLPYCKSVVEQHGGSISVATDPTTFTISLPKKIIPAKSI